MCICRHARANFRPGAISVFAPYAVFARMRAVGYLISRVVVRHLFSPQRDGHFRAGMLPSLQQLPYAVPSCDRVSKLLDQRKSLLASSELGGRLGERGLVVPR
jgi:hypothetical protein